MAVVQERLLSGRTRLPAEFGTFCEQRKLLRHRELRSGCKDISARQRRDRRCKSLKKRLSIPIFCDYQYLLGAHINLSSKASSTTVLSMSFVGQSLRKTTLNSEMITRKQRFQQTAVVWPYTPEPSPKLRPNITDCEVTEDLNMTGEEYAKSRPISVASPREGILSPGGRPTLDDVLNGRAPSPYTLAAYTAFLSQQHCLETLEFTMEAKSYREKYDAASAHFAGMPLNNESDEGYELQQDWMRVLDIYVKPGAPREINLPAEERDDLVDYPCGARPPPPEAFDPAVKRMFDLMSESIFIPFCNSMKRVDHAQTYNALSDYARDEPRMDPSRMTYDDRGMTARRQLSPQQESPPRSSSPSHLEVGSRSTNPAKRKTQSSNLTSALNRPRSTQLRQLGSNTSAVSTGESAITDNSDSGESPGPSDAPVTPPTTPPGSDMGMGASHMSVVTPKQGRSDSGGWSKFGKKIWGNKKKGSGSGSLRERSDE